MKILLYGINFAPELTGIGKYTGEMAAFEVGGMDCRAALAMTEFSLPVLLRQVFWRAQVVWVVEPALFCALAAACAPWPMGKVVGQRIPLTDGQEGGHEALLLHIDRSTRAPVSFRGVPYERVLNTTRVMPRVSYQRLLMEGLHATHRWETLPALGVQVDSLDTREMVVTLEEAIRRGRMEDPGTRDPLGLLRGLGLLVQGEQLSRAAVALFCKDDVSLPEFPQFSLRVARFKGTTRDEFLDNRQYAGNAFALMRRAERFLIDWLPVAGKIVPGQMARIDTPALPTEAVREALANAFIHRDYASAAGAVAVALYDDRLEIISPGELHFGFTPEMLFEPHESKPWNPWIAKVFHRRGLIETWGRGTLKMAGLMQEAGLQPPTVTVKGDCVMLTFRLAQSFGGGRSEKTLGKTPGKTPDAVFAHLHVVPHASIPELAEYLGKSESAIERAVRKLQEEGRLQRVGPAKGGYWQVLLNE